MRTRPLMYGNTPVPWTVSWSSEQNLRVERCPFAGRLAICQDSSPGIGEPIFAKPHSSRQRQAIAHGLCDLCGKPLRLRTKVSLSKARPIAHSARGFEILQVEPLLHVECAAASVRWCPSLKRDIAAGTLMVRSVTRHDVQFAVMSREYVATLTGQFVPAIGHAKVQLLKWRDRDLAWLQSVAPQREVAA